VHVCVGVYCVYESQSDSNRVGSSFAECFMRQYVRVTGPDEKVDMVRPVIREESVLRLIGCVMVTQFPQVAAMLCDGDVIPQIAAVLCNSDLIFPRLLHCCVMVM